jgi:hypothetical protein
MRPVEGPARASLCRCARAQPLERSSSAPVQPSRWRLVTAVALRHFRGYALSQRKSFHCRFSTLWRTRVEEPAPSMLWKRFSSKRDTCADRRAPRRCPDLELEKSPGTERRSRRAAATRAVSRRQTLKTRQSSCSSTTSCDPSDLEVNTAQLGEGADALSRALAILANSVPSSELNTEARIVHEGRGLVAEGPRVAWSAAALLETEPLELPAASWISAQRPSRPTRSATARPPGTVGRAVR